jgi:predicted hydrocarbon binding protein
MGREGESMSRTVRAPDALEPLFARAEPIVDAYFSKIERSPENGTLRVSGERYVMIRAASLATGFLHAMRGLVSEQEALRFWYRVAHSIGREDSRAWSAQFTVATAEERLSFGPVQFAHAGWARVEIDPHSRPTQDEDYYLEYTHPNTFESETALAQKLVGDQPVCVFSAGYSAGWCSESFGVEVDAREVTCVAAGGRECRFVMSPWYQLDAHIARLRQRLGG